MIENLKNIRIIKMLGKTDISSGDECWLQEVPTHYDVIELELSSGKHLICEKTDIEKIPSNAMMKFRQVNSSKMMINTRHVISCEPRTLAVARIKQEDENIVTRAFLLCEDDTATLIGKFETEDAEN